MTHQNKSAPLTGDEIRAAVKHAHNMSGPSDATQPGEYVLAGALALLSKLRAPVAELRIGVSATAQGATVCIMQPHSDGSMTTIYSETHPIGDSVGRAALASAPVADESPMAKMADALREKGRQEQQAYQDSRVQSTEWGPMPHGTEADLPASAPVADVKDWRIDTSAGGPILVYKDCSVIESEQAEYVLRLIAADQASAPVAGEAIATLHGDGYWTWKKPRYTHDPAFMRMDVYAAPQASAEYERGHADGWAAAWDQAIKQPQADKDGGQQRAGDVSAEAHKAALLEVERAGAELAGRLHAAATSLETISQIAGKAGKDMETMDDVRGYAASRARAARAALSATQPEQGERDA